MFIVARKVAKDFTQFAIPSKKQERLETSNGKILGLLKLASAKCVFTKREEIPFLLLPQRSKIKRISKVEAAKPGRKKEEKQW